MTRRNTPQSEVYFFAEILTAVLGIKRASNLPERGGAADRFRQYFQYFHAIVDEVK